jgi:hypothetical protein
MNYAKLLKDFNADIQADLKNLEDLMDRLDFAESFTKNSPDILMSHVISQVAIGKASLMAKVEEALRGRSKGSK